jgi:hypothetical protein
MCLCEKDFIYVCEVYLVTVSDVDYTAVNGMRGKVQNVVTYFRMLYQH